MSLLIFLKKPVKKASIIFHVITPADHNSEDAGDGAHGLSSLSEKTT